MTVTDNDDSTNTISHDITILDLAPTSKFSWTPEPQNEGSKTQCIDESTSTTDLIVAWCWDFAGIETYNEKDPTFTFFDNGIYTVTLTVTDDDGSTSTTSNQITVNNVPPIVEAGDDQIVNEGDSVAFAGSFSDAGSADTHTIVWDFGDGSGETGALMPAHVYVDDFLHHVIVFHKGVNSVQTP